MNKDSFFSKYPQIRQNPFQCPEDYFESFGLKFYEKYFSNGESFQVPHDYFTHNDLFLRVLTGRESEPFEVPEHYFTHNDRKISNVLTEKSAADNFRFRILPLSIHRKLAIAASISGMILAGTLFYFFLNRTPRQFSDSHPCATLACLSRKDLLEKTEWMDQYVLEEALSEEDSFPILRENQTNTSPDSASKVQ